MYHWEAEKDVEARRAQSLAEAAQDAQLPPGEVDKKSGRSQVTHGRKARLLFSSHTGSEGQQDRET